MTQLCLRKLDLKRIIFAHLHRLWDWKVLTKPILKSIFSDLKWPFCIPVMRIKYCISPKSYYTVMNIPSHCQESGDGALWCLPYWWAIILLKGSVWTRSQEAWIFSCGAPTPCSSSWATATPVIPVSADLSPHCTKWATEYSHYFSRGAYQPTGWASEERSDTGLEHFLLSTRSLGHLGPMCHFDPCPPSGNFYQEPQEAEEF